MNKNNKYEAYNLETVKKFKTSDIIFLVGSGPSLNRINNKQLTHIKEHNSLGINHSFVKKDLIPTFHHHGWHSGQYLEYTTKFKNYRKANEGVINFLHYKHLFRLIHPLTTKNLFPSGVVRVCYYDVPLQIIKNEKHNTFQDSDFYKSLRYRGIMSLCLDIVHKIGYKKIVLLGVDLNTSSHFYDDYSFRTKDDIKIDEQVYKDKLGIKYGNSKFESMYSIKGKYLLMDEYYYSVADFLKRIHNVELFVCFSDNSLYPKLPSYF